MNGEGPCWLGRQRGIVVTFGAYCPYCAEANMAALPDDRGWDSVPLPMRCAQLDLDGEPEVLEGVERLDMRSYTGMSSGVSTWPGGFTWRASRWERLREGFWNRWARFRYRLACCIYPAWSVGYDPDDYDGEDEDGVPF